jgi:orotidine-5'-phosphate decarboxylase
MVITDAKRGDIGSTMTAYAQAYLDQSSPLATDALTVNPYLGYESLRPALDLAAAQRCGIFVLGLTSNPEAGQVQHALAPQGGSVAAAIVAGVAADNAGCSDLGDVGLVVGATIGSAAADLGIDLAASHAPLLAPGIGAQGAGAAELAQVFGAAVRNVLPSSSREVLAAGPSVTALQDAADRTLDACRAVLGDT